MYLFLEMERATDAVLIHIQLIVFVFRHSMREYCSLRGKGSVAVLGLARAILGCQSKFVCSIVQSGFTNPEDHRLVKSSSSKEHRPFE